MSDDVTHREIADQVAASRRETAALAREVADLKADVAKTLDLVEAYAAIKTGGRFVTWLSKVLAALLAIWVLTKGAAVLLVDLGLQGKDTV